MQMPVLMMRQLRVHYMSRHIGIIVVIIVRYAVAAAAATTAAAAASQYRCKHVRW